MVRRLEPPIERVEQSTLCVTAIIEFPPLDLTDSTSGVPELSLAMYPLRHFDR